MGDEVKVTSIPPCDFCKMISEEKPARYDGRTGSGHWAYMCEAHWKIHGIGTLGTGHGQRLVVDEG